MQWGMHEGAIVTGPEDTMRETARRTETLRVLRTMKLQEITCPPANGQSWGLNTGQMLQGRHPPAHDMGSSRTKQRLLEWKGQDTESRGAWGML